MDADILRLILFVAGVALIVGIYFWDRRKKINLKINAIRKAERGKREREPLEPRREPIWEEAVENDIPSAGAPAAPEIDETLRKIGELVHEEGVDKQRDKAAKTARQTSFEFDDGPGRTRADPAPTKIVQLNVVGRHADIPGDVLMQAARDLHLEPGEMQIFHRYDERRNAAPTLFSMASMVEPGTFPFDSMDGFTTPGVTLFAQLPGPREGLELFELMHETALRLAALLDGEVLDGSRSVLSRQTVEHMREEISEHGRLVRLARSH